MPQYPLVLVLGGFTLQNRPSNETDGNVIPPVATGSGAVIPSQVYRLASKWSFLACNSRIYARNDANLWCNDRFSHATVEFMLVLVQIWRKMSISYMQHVTFLLVMRRFVSEMIIMMMMGQADGCTCVDVQRCRGAGTP